MNFPFGSLLEKLAIQIGIENSCDSQELMGIIAFFINGLFAIISIFWICQIIYKIFFKSYNSEIIESTGTIRADQQAQKKEKISEEIDYFEKVKLSVQRNLLSIIALTFFVLIGIATKGQACIK